MADCIKIKGRFHESSVIAEFSSLYEKNPGHGQILYAICHRFKQPWLFKPMAYVLYSTCNKDNSPFPAFLSVNRDQSQTMVTRKQLSDGSHLLSTYRRNNPPGCWENPRNVCLRQLVIYKLFWCSFNIPSKLLSW